MKNHTTVGVLGLAVRKNNGNVEFFLTQRLNTKRPEAHLKWQIPGGELEFGETPEETVVRELKEELDITAKIIYPNPIVISHTWHNLNSKSGAHLVLLTYLVTMDNQNPRNIDPDKETGAIGWFTLEQINNLSMLPKSDSVIINANKVVEQNGILR